MRPAADLTDRFLIIGAGPVGLAMALEMRRCGFPFDQVDAHAEVGGVWLDGVYPMVRTISPRSMCQHPAQPLDPAGPTYLTREDVRAYLRDFARDHDLSSGVRFNTRVTLATPEPDESWLVQFCDGSTARYRGVISCIGHSWDPVKPALPGHFDGTIIHSRDYRTPEQIAGRRILVVGLGQSGADLAMEATRHGACAHLSIRHGKYLLPRDLNGRSLMEQFPGTSSPARQQMFVRSAYRNYVPDAEALGLPPPALPPLEENNLCWTDDLPDALRAGQVEIRRPITNLSGHTVTFADGREDEYDTILLATGYHVSFPFLPDGFVPMTNARTPRLFLGAVLPGYRHLYLTGSLEAVSGFGQGGYHTAAIVCELIATQERLTVPLGSAATWLGYPYHRTNTTSDGRARQIRRIIPFWLWVARIAHRLWGRRWRARHAAELPAWLKHSQPAAATG